MRRRSVLAFCAGLALLAAASGCTSRGITVTSTPPGAEVSVNRRVVGKTPIRVNYTHYGLYRIELRKERYETLVRDENLQPPIYGYDPLTFFVDNLIPARINDETYLHYVLQPVGEKVDREGLLQRAAQARDGRLTHPQSGDKYTVSSGVESGVKMEKAPPPPPPEKPAPKTDEKAPPPSAGDSPKPPA